jgi:hypothetical protein
MADEPTTDKLTVRQHKALIALMTETSVSKAAVVAEVPERTLRSWLKRAEFEAVYRVYRRDATRQATALGQQYSGQVMRNEVRLALTAKREADQIAAGKIVLDFVYRATEIEDLRDEIARLADLVREMNNDSSDL